MSIYQPAITFFTAPKPFRGPVGKAQERAIRSWLRLGSGCEVLLVGDEFGIAEWADALGVRHVPHVERNEFGTPLVNSIFRAAEGATTSRLLCYINTDIILMKDFMERVSSVPFPHFLLVGRRWDVDPQHVPDLAVPGWEEQLQQQAVAHGLRQRPTHIDYFVYTRGIWPSIPPFALGRTIWDNWLISCARIGRVPVVDASDVIWAIHQNHDYSHHPQGYQGVWQGTEAARNLRLAGGPRHAFTIEDATWVLSAGGLRRAAARGGLRSRLARLPALYPWLGATVDVLKKPARPPVHFARRMVSRRAGRALPGTEQL